MALQLFHSTRGRVVDALRRGDATIEELAAAIGQTSSALRALIRGMQKDGLVEPAGTRAGTTRRFTVYRLTTQAEQLLSRAYIPFLTELVRSLTQRQPEASAELMRDVGVAFAHSLALKGPRGQPIEARLAAASELLNVELGAVTSVVQIDGEFRIQGSGCPLAAITDKHPGACLAIASMLQELLDTHVTECCERAGKPRCCFRITEPDPLS